MSLRMLACSLCANAMYSASLWRGSVLVGVAGCEGLDCTGGEAHLMRPLSDRQVSTQCAETSLLHFLPERREGPNSWCMTPPLDAGRCRQEVFSIKRM